MKITRRSNLIELLTHFNLPKRVAEIGVAEGRYSLEIFNWGVEALYLVDVWEHIPFMDGCAGHEQSWHNYNYEAVRKLFDGKENVHILKGFSHKVADQVEDESLGLVYLDGDHTDKGSMADLKIWIPKLVNGGIMAGHDFMNPTYGVKKSVDEFTSGKYEVHTMEENGAIENMGFWFQKK